MGLQLVKVMKYIWMIKYSLTLSMTYVQDLLDYRMFRDSQFSD